MSSENTNAFEGITDVGQALELLNRYRRDFPDDKEGAKKMLDDLLDAMRLSVESSGEQLTGDADAFHNIAVDIINIKGENLDALEIVREGLKIHSANPDLLADAIRYGYNCGAKEECEKWYIKLELINKCRWTWRAFSFSIDYLIAEQNSPTGKYSSDDNILTLIKEYQVRLPDREDTWLCEFEYYNASNQKKKAIGVLEDAMGRFRFCPKCWLRYADIMMDDGEYKKAEPVIKKLRRNVRTGEYVKMSYVFYLDGECKMDRFLESEGYEEGNFDEKEVLKIYRDFRLALGMDDITSHTVENIRLHINRLEKETGIPYGWES